MRAQSEGDKVPVRSLGGSRARRRRAGGQAGFSLLEILIAIGVLIVGVLGFSQAVLRSVTTNESTREGALAAEAARQMLETLQAQTLSDVFELYNDDPTDDPGPPGSAPGSDFAVAGLDPLVLDPDGFVGRIEFPTLAAAPGVLREDIFNATLGMPRDLNGDGFWDAADHATDYRVLPVIVRITWRGSATDSVAMFYTVLGNY